MYKGSCLCGKIHIEINTTIDSIIHCHCSLCRKSTGTAFATNGFVNKKHFNIVLGNELLSKFEFKEGRNRYFCQCCGSPIFSENSQDSSRIRVRLGLLSSEIKERPISHNFVTSKANWYDLDDSLPRYEAFEPSRK